MSELYFTQDVPTLLTGLKTDLEGLSTEEAQSRLMNHGPNKLPEGKKITWLRRFLAQFKNVMVIVLLVAGLVSALVGEVGSTAVILVVVVLNAILGVFQESKAEKSLEALSNLSAPKAKVKRANQVLEISSEELVTGDIVLLEAGNTVPADLRLFEVASIKVEEATLTGESLPVEKDLALITNPNAPLGDRKNMLFLGSQVVYGRGSGIVVSTGADTEMGKIAQHLQTTKEQITPLQKRLATLSATITKGVILIAAIVFGIGLLWGRPLLDMFMVAVSLAVSAIPEGLPAVVTILLALGVQRMAKRNAIIRKLSAVETLGCTQIICSDKTGTLTQNRMTVQKIYTHERLLASDQIGEVDDVFIQALALCNDVTGEDEALLGDPTETALVALTTAKTKTDLLNQYPRIGELPFESERKLMTTIHQAHHQVRYLTKGAPDVLLDHCTQINTSKGVIALTEDIRQSITQQISQLSQQALRVLAFANKDEKELVAEQAESQLTFLGLVGMIDPPRAEAKAAVAACQMAGIAPIMITGDHLDTAVAIAKDLGILGPNNKAITGTELSALSDQQLATRINEFRVYARVAPEHKVRIVKAWQKRGKIVAMTGDGVNDAPALKTADIGVGMGITGTDVSKSVSSMVLTDDNFATIVLAVEEGRTIYANIQRAIQFLLSTNLGEVVFLFIGTLLNYTVLLPIHILWINLVTDTFPALALGFEKGTPDTMNRPPRENDANFLSDGVGKAVLYQGLASGLLSTATFFLGLSLYGPDIAMTMAFLAVGATCLFHSFNLRSNTLSLLKTGFISNIYLLLAFFASALLHSAVILVPPLRELFQLSPLSFQQWLITLGISFLIIPLVEIVKAFKRRK